MSADRLYCYLPQRKAVLNWMHEIGAIVSSKSPCGVEHHMHLAGLEHINFVEVVGMKPEVPEAMWRILRERGAIVMRLDDHWARERHVLHTQHLREPA